MIDKLDYFIALAAERHFGRAAERLGITQPTLSAGLRQLEAQLGVTLVNRGSRFQGITAEGERVLVWARRISGDVRAMRDDISGLDGLRGHLTIAVIPTALAIVAKLTTPFLDRHPDVTFEILSRTSAEIVAGLEDFEFDLGITYLDERLQRAEGRLLYSERYCLVTANTADGEGRERISWAEAAKLRLCLLTGAMQNRRILDRHLREAGGPFRTAMESNSMIALMAHVRTGRFATIMPLRSAEILGLGDSVRTVPIVDPDVSYDVALARSQRSPHIPLVERFWAESAEVAFD
ncbi:LysR family transcriptional regulator [Mangrovicella endophytica]|uniref:LysR family transcriptional regulator n=1 Tax=Mangrovicella endophytica TaxID=2066697 RepID=UPI000C9DB652|nr:LysR family transcriptional regulator [Mangrovicella endophytica]